VTVAVFVGVAVCVAVMVAVTVAVFVGVAVCVAVAVGVTVAVLVAVAVGVTVAVVVDVAEGVEQTLVIVNVHPPDIMPRSPPVSSTRYRLQMPLGSVPLKIESDEPPDGVGAGATHVSPVP